MPALQRIFKSYHKDKSGTYECKSNPNYPKIDDLIKKAEVCAESCLDMDQLIICTSFFQNVAIRGMMSKRYNIDETRRCTTILEYMRSKQAHRIYPIESYQRIGQ